MLLSEKEMETLKFIFIFIVVVGGFTYLFNAFLNFITQPYEHSDEVKRMLDEK